MSPCFLGPIIDNSRSAVCVNADFDHDGDRDLKDWAVFQNNQK